MKILYPIIILCLCSCLENSSRLNSALEQSGTNRMEMEKVLNHYRQNASDSLKLQAAIFLIENMRGHYSLESGFIDRFRKNLPNLYPDKPYAWYKTIETVPERAELNNLWYKAYDLEWIKGNYLIHHIDHQFQMWKTTPWLSDLSFQDFCEYLLPYRVSREAPDAFSDSILIHTQQLKALTEKLPMRFTPQYIYDLLETFYPKDSYFKIEEIPLNSDKAYTLGCLDKTLYEIFSLKLYGLPIALDYVPYWGDRNGQHYWHTLITPAYPNHILPQALNRVPKVYRRTYSHQPFPQESAEESIPSPFNTPFLKDVTQAYTNPADVSLIVPQFPTQLRYAYLCVFNEQEWHPVSWSEVRRGKVCFQNMGRDLVYLPVYYQAGKMTPTDYPFILKTNGKTETLIPDTCCLQSVHLTRKAPVDNHKLLWSQELKGGYFEASNTPDFKNSERIYQTDSLNPDLTVIQVENPRAYRYWRYTHSHYRYMAEIQFFDTTGQELHGQVLPPAASFPITLNLGNIFDHDPLTYGVIYPSAGLDLGHPVRLGTIHYLPRNDANGIFPGNWYELKFHNGQQWISLGKKEATHYDLEFDKVPSHALYWLRNLTTGREERIFTYENGKQVFW